MTENNKSLAYVNLIGKNSEGNYEYDIYFSETPDIVWAENWAEQPSSACENMPPGPDTFSEIISIESEYFFSLAQNNDCFSMQDCIDGIISMCWVQDNGKCILNLHFGESYENVKKKLENIGVAIK